MHNGKNIRLCFAGNMLGKNPGYVTTQGQVIAELFESEGFDVVCTSSKINRAARLADLARTLVRRDFDVVVLEVYSGLNLLMAETAGALCRHLKLPLVMVLHGGKLPEFVESYPRWARRVLGRADMLVAPSRYMAEKIGAQGFDVEVIPNVLDLSAYPYRERRQISPRLIWMRSFHPTYNPLMAVRVLEKLRKKFPAAQLTMAGVDKGMEREVQQTAERLGLSKAVDFPGFLDMEKKVRAFSDADVFINTNRHDNMPVSVIEACAMGLPVVATNVGGLPYLISHGINGLLVSNDNVGSMATAVGSLIEHPDITNEISRNARSLAEQSDWLSVRVMWEKAFDRVLDPGGRTRASGIELCDIV